MIDTLMRQLGTATNLKFERTDSEIDRNRVWTAARDGIRVYITPDSVPVRVVTEDQWSAQCIDSPTATMCDVAETILFGLTVAMFDGPSPAPG